MKQVHWHEGLFLQPHHLQQMQRGWLELQSRERRLASAFPYGVIEAQLSRDALKDYWVRYERLRVVMPASGLEVNISQNADLNPLHLKRFFQEGAKRLRVFLAVPFWSKGANTLSRGSADSHEKLLYNVVEEAHPDENTGLNPQPLLFRKIRARLLVEGEDDSGLETLELLRVERDPRDPLSAPREDPTFVPASLLLSSSHALWQLVRDLAYELEVHRDSLARKIKQAGFSYDNMQAGQLEKVLRLRTLNRGCARLAALLGASSPVGESAEPAVQRAGRAGGPVGGLSPFSVFAELSELLGELAALRLGHTAYGEEAYAHEEPYACLDVVCNKIRSFLVAPDEDKPLEVEFKLMDRFPTAALQPAHFTQPNRYFLGIRTDQDPDKLAAYVENADKFKLLDVKHVASRQLVEGLKLKRAVYVPPNLPGFKDLFFFHIDIANSLPGRWDWIREDGRMAIWRIDNEKAVCGVDLSKAIFTLYMIVPPKAATA